MIASSAPATTQPPQRRNALSVRSNYNPNAIATLCSRQNNVRIGDAPMRKILNACQPTCRPMRARDWPHAKAEGTQPRIGLFGDCGSRFHRSRVRQGVPSSWPRRTSHGDSSTDSRF
jgi:hypothetical protein